MTEATLPIFTVVCLCHNQARFLPQALDSVVRQEYPGRVQLVLVDDASTDGSVQAAEAWLAGHSMECQTIFLQENLGNCRAFNRALPLVEGDFVIDLAADDQLATGRLAAHARAFIANRDAAMVYGDAWYVDAKGEKLYRQADKAGSNPPQGDVFGRLFLGNFICPSTVTFRTEALRRQGGYDERLAFEDFDVWIRLAREGEVRYVPEVASLHRVAAGSLSGRFYRGGNPKMARSAALIGKKALGLANTRDEREAIAQWLRFQARLAAYMGYPLALNALGRLYRQASGKPLCGFGLLRAVARMGLGWAYRWYLKARYQ